MLTAWPLLLRCWIVSLLLAVGLGAAVHPRDGVDADVRFTLGDRSLRAVIVLNLAFVDGIVDGPREDPEEVSPGQEEQRLGAALASFFATHNTVVCDGLALAPVVVSFGFEAGDSQLLPLYPDGGLLSLSRVRLVLDYPLTTPPRRIELTWGAYPDEAEWETSRGAGRVAVQARLAVPGDEVWITFSEDEPGYSWHRNAQGSNRFDALPPTRPPSRPTLHLLSGALLLALLLAILRGGARARRSLSWSVPLTLLGAWVGWSVVVVPLPFGDAGLPDTEEARAIFTSLQANIYRAFDETSESEIYDALARSVDGKLLATLYEQIYRGLIMADQGGAVSRVSAVRMISAEVESIGTLPPDDRPGFVVDARWQVDGVVHHWGHSHSRTNAYHARYTVAAEPRGWRIVGSQILEQRRIGGSPAARPGSAPPTAPVPAFEALQPNEGWGQ